MGQNEPWVERRSPAVRRQGTKEALLEQILQDRIGAGEEALYSGEESSGFGHAPFTQQAVNVSP